MGGLQPLGVKTKMEIPTFEMDPELAREKWRELLKCPAIGRLEKIRRRVYRAMSKGRKIIDVTTVIEKAGLNPSGQPRLAICRADKTKCYFEIYANGSAVFTARNLQDWRRSSRTNRFVDFNLGPGTFPRNHTNALSTMAPVVPAELIPKDGLEKYWLLWEVDKWEQVPPRDPLLLRRLSKNLFAIIAEWSLSPLEWAISRGAN